MKQQVKISDWLCIYLNSILTENSYDNHVQLKNVDGCSSLNEYNTSEINSLV